MAAPTDPQKDFAAKTKAKIAELNELLAQCGKVGVETEIVVLETTNMKSQVREYRLEALFRIVI